jgi:dihydrofolate reductase
MRKVVLAVSSSLDGYIARPNGEVDFLSMPKDLSTPPFSAAIDTYVLGRKTYDVARKMGGGYFALPRRSTFSRARYPLAKAPGTFLLRNLPPASCRKSANNLAKTFG